MERPVSGDQPEAIETYVWVDEHDWLRDIHKSPENCSPQFRVPDLLGACVSIVFSYDDPPGILFRFLSSKLILRNPHTKRRQERMWREHYELLQGLQRSPANRYPHPSFSLDQLTTACVAIVKADEADPSRIFVQARLNTAHRNGGASGNSRQLGD